MRQSAFSSRVLESCPSRNRRGSLTFSRQTLLQNPFNPGRTFMATDAQGRTLDRRETASLIGSDKVEGTAVYRSNGDKVGQIERVLIDKINGKGTCAGRRFGG